jgi:rhodanese-related sulfurtransferase
LKLSPDEVRADKLSAQAADISWTGSLEMPRGCGTPDACQVRFNLSANQIALGELREWVSPHPKERPWYRVLESGAQAGTPFLASLRASGRVTTEHLLAQGLAATHVSANVSLDSGKLQISELNADFLGGKHRGEWRADFGAKPAVCTGSGNLTGVSLAGLADTKDEAWIAGTADASYEVKGNCPAEFWTTAEGTLQFDVRDGALPHVSLAEDAGALKIIRFSGKARVQAGKIELKDAKLDSVGGKFLVNGTASWKRELDLKLARSQNGKAGYTITGTLAEPRVVQVSSPETRAQLKTEPTK